MDSLIHCSSIGNLVLSFGYTYYALFDPDYQIYLSLYNDGVSVALPPISPDACARLIHVQPCVSKIASHW